MILLILFVYLVVSCMHVRGGGEREERERKEEEEREREGKEEMREDLMRDASERGREKTQRGMGG